MNSSEYKKYHETYMQHNLGSTPVHTFSYIFLVVLCTILGSMFRCRKKSQQYVSEYMIIIVPMILGYTVLSEYIIELNFIVAVILCAFTVFHRRSIHLRLIFNEKNLSKTERVLAVTLMRSLTYLITAFSILGVDFPVYPRFLAKTEAYGYSVMDTGVGLFVLMSGLVHRDYGKDKISLFVKNNLKLFTILLSLGILRLLSIKHLDYHEHVTEYGVHWNFFFTLAVSKVISSVILFFCSPNYSLILSLLVIILHEIQLFYGLETWVFSNTIRDSIINANREGISSCLGYIALYLVAVHFKYVLLDKKVIKSHVLSKLLLGAGISWILTSVVNEYRPISRTLANFGYWSYLTLILLTVLTVLYFFEVLLEDQKYFLTLPTILSDIHHNGLLYFLCANLLTGAVNLSMQTLFIGALSAILILNVYMMSTIVIAVLLKKRGIRL